MCRAQAGGSVPGPGEVTRPASSEDDDIAGPVAEAAGADGAGVSAESGSVVVGGSSESWVACANWAR